MTQKDDPKRLRECLAALSEACGHDVFRFETVTTKTGMRFIITAPRETGEKSIAVMIAAELRRYYEKIELKTDNLESDE